MFLYQWRSSVQNSNSLNSFRTEASTDARCICIPFLLITANECSDFIALLYFTASSAIVLSKHLKAGCTPNFDSCLTYISSVSVSNLPQPLLLKTV